MDRVSAETAGDDVAAMHLVKVERLDGPFLTGGDRASLIGAQDGGFPRMGWHLPGEMGGVWAHPIKLLDGFELTIHGQRLPPACGFISGFWWSAQRHEFADGLTVERRQFAPDGEPAVLVRYAFTTPNERKLALRFSAQPDLRGVWPAPPNETEGVLAAYEPGLDGWVCRRREGDGYVVIAGDRAPESASVEGDASTDEVCVGHGGSVDLAYGLVVAGGETVFLDIVIAGEAADPAGAAALLGRVRGNGDVFWREKATRYAEMMKRSVLALPEPSIPAAWDWLKANNDWLVRDVPGVGRGLGAGAPYYVWWFGCDSAYAALGCVALGQHALAVETLDLVRRLSEEADPASGRVMHETNTRGEVVHPGCVQETPHFVDAVWQTFRWTGDLGFLQRNYDFCRRGLLQWTLEAQCRDGDLLPYGYGITEVEGLDRQCLDTAVHTATALEALAGMAEVLGDAETVERCLTLAPVVRTALETRFWMEEEGLYGDMLATPAEMVPRLRAWIALTEGMSREGEPRPVWWDRLEALLRAAEGDPERDRVRPWLLGHWMVITPLAAGLTEGARAQRVLNRVETAEFGGQWGMYLGGLARQQAMSINTGVLAGTQLRYGRGEAGIASLRQLTDTLGMHMPGAIAEISPDDGCHVQAWSAYAIAWPMVTVAFGLEPDAHRKRLQVEPHFPAAWKDARLSHVRVGETWVDCVWDGVVMRVTVHEAGWTVCSDSVPLEVTAP